MSAIPADSYGVLLLLFNASLIKGLAGGEGVTGVSGTPPLCKPFLNNLKYSGGENWWEPPVWHSMPTSPLSPLKNPGDALGPC